MNNEKFELSTSFLLEYLVCLCHNCHSKKHGYEEK